MAHKAFTLPKGIESQTCCKDTLGQNLPKAAMNVTNYLRINEHRVKTSVVWDQLLSNQKEQSHQTCSIDAVLEATGSNNVY